MNNKLKEKFQSIKWMSAIFISAFSIALGSVPGDFDGLVYVNMYPDLVNASRSLENNPVERAKWGVNHYLSFGQKEGRKYKSDMGIGLDVNALIKHPDVSFVKHGDHQGQEASLLKDPAGNFVCMDYKQDQKQVYFGHVKDGKCLSEAWGKRENPMSNGLYYVKAKGSWVDRNKLSGDQFAKTALIQKGGPSNWISGVASFNGLAGKNHPGEQEGLWGIDEKGQIVSNIPLMDGRVKVFVPNLPADFDGLVYVNMHPDLVNASKSLENNPVERAKWGVNHYLSFGQKEGRKYKSDMGIGLDVNALIKHPDVSFVKHGDHQGQEASLLKDPAGNFVCMDYKQDQKQVYFGHVKDGKCLSEAWGKRENPMSNGLYYVKAKGSWVDRNKLSGDQFAKTALVQKGGPSTWVSGVASFNGLAGKTHPGDQEALWGINEQGQIVSNIPLTDGRLRVFVPNLPGDFKGETYVKLHSDLINASRGKNLDDWGLSHYLSFGQKEGRKYKEDGAPAASAVPAAPAITSNPSAQQRLDEINKLYTIDSRIELVLTSDGALKGPENKNFVCAYSSENPVVNTNHQLVFGFVDKDRCVALGWDKKRVIMGTDGFYVRSKTGSTQWRALNTINEEDFKKTILVRHNDKSLHFGPFQKNGPISKMNIGIGSIDGDQIGKTHPDTTFKGIWLRNVNDQDLIQQVGSNAKVFIPDAAPAASSSPVVPVSSTPASPAAVPASTAADISQYAIDSRIQLVLNSDGALKDPVGNFVCAFPSEHSDKDAKRQLVFGFVNNNQCVGQGWGTKPVINMGVDGYYVKSTTGSTQWKKFSELSDADFAKTVLVKGNAYSSMNMGIGSYGGKGAKTHPGTIHKGVWFKDVNGQTLGGQTGDNVMVFIPDAAPASAASSAPAALPSPVAPVSSKPASSATVPALPAADISQYAIDSRIQLVLSSDGALKDPAGNFVCAFPSEHSDKDAKRQLVFGFVNNNQCIGQGWGTKPVINMGVDGYYVKSTTGSTQWKKFSELNDADFAKTVLVKGNAYSSMNMGIGSYGGKGAKTHPDTVHKGVWFKDIDGKTLGGQTGDDVMIFIPDAAPAAAAAAAPAASSSPASPATVSASTAVTPVSNTTVVSSQPTESAAVPDVSGQQFLTMTNEQIGQEILQGKMIAADPDSASTLEQQPPLDILGEPYKWVALGRGFALDPVELSAHNGVVCRFLEQGTMYIGNLYKNKFDSPNAKVGDIICRAATNLDNLVYLTKTFETLSGREGSLPLWQPMMQVAPENWETGYRTVNVAQEHTENGKTFKMPGVCRVAKDGNPAHFHIGRAEIDQNGQPHCYMKKGGKQQDWAGDDLNNVEVLVRGNVQQSSSTGFFNQQNSQGDLNPNFRSTYGNLALSGVPMGG